MKEKNIFGKTSTPVRGSRLQIILTFVYLLILTFVLLYAFNLESNPYDLTYPLKDMQITWQLWSMDFLVFYVGMPLILTVIIHYSLSAGIGLIVLSGLLMATRHTQGVGAALLPLVIMLLAGISMLGIPMRRWFRIRRQAVRRGLLIAPFVILLIIAGFVYKPISFDYCMSIDTEYPPSVYQQKGYTTLNQNRCLTALAIKEQNPNFCSQMTDPSSFMSDGKNSYTPKEWCVKEFNKAIKP